MSLKDRLLQYMRESGKEWVSKKELADFARSLGPLGETAGRRLRELVTDDKKLERSKGYYASYRLIQNTFGVPTALSEAQAQIKEQGPEPLFDNAPEVPAKPVTLSKKVSTLWEGARSRVGGRPRYSERSQAGPSERFSESTALVQELSRFKDLKYTKEPNYILREGA